MALATSLVACTVAGAAPVVEGGDALTFDRTGAKVGEQLPDLTVHTLDGQPTAFRNAWDGVLVTVSLTCPKSREKYPDIRALATRLKGTRRVSILYVVEAHPDQDPSPYKRIVDVTPENRRDGILFRQPRTLADRLSLARAFRDRFDVPREIEIFVDGMSDDAWAHVGGGPNMALLIDATGVVGARQGWFDAAKLEPAAAATAAGPAGQREATPLHGAARDGDLAAVDELLRGGADVDARAGGGPTPLDEALLHNRGEVANRLLSAGATTNFHTSSALGEVNLVRRMLQADPTLARRRDGWGRDALDYAAAGGRIDVARLLIEHGATDDRAPGSTEPLALHWAARHGRAAVAALLLDRAGADPRARDDAGRTPLDRAAELASSARAPASAAATRDLLMEALGRPVKPVPARPAKVIEAPVAVP